MVIGRTPEALLWELLGAVTESGASDLHVSSGRVPILRVDGKLKAVEGVPPISADDVSDLVQKILGTERAATFFAKRQEVDVSFSPERADARFRVNVYWSRQEPAIAMRNLPLKIPALRELHLPETLYRFTEPRQGFVLISGPSGHGKTTTMSSLVNHINQTRSAHIVTIEDPIEYLYAEEHCLIHQREVGPDTPSFPDALRSALREDPNVVVVGEMRDLDTISTALTVAETGHLVFSTIHTNDAAQTIDRIVDVFPAARQAEVRMQLAATLTGIVSLRLLPRASGKGRLHAVEILVGTPAVRNLIREGETAQIPSMIQTGHKHGMISLEQSLRSLVTRGEISPDEVMNYLSGTNVLEESATP